MVTITPDRVAVSHGWSELIRVGMSRSEEVRSVL